MNFFKTSNFILTIPGIKVVNVFTRSLAIPECATVAIHCMPAAYLSTATVCRLRNRPSRFAAAFSCFILLRVFKPTRCRSSLTVTTRKLLYPQLGCHAVLLCLNTTQVHTCLMSLLRSSVCSGDFIYCALSTPRNLYACYSWMGHPWSRVFPTMEGGMVRDQIEWGQGLDRVIPPWFNILVIHCRVYIR